MVWSNLCMKLSMIAVLVSCLACQSTAGNEWEIHDENRPQPPLVTPGEYFIEAPSDAKILFDGSDMSQWQHGDGEDVRWKLVQGRYMEVVGDTGDIRTRQSFGDCQLYIEWASPIEVRGSGQRRGNSGVFLMDRYEIQILDSYQNPTYPDGQAGSIYGQNPPLVNASRGPGQWQSYNIIWRGPRFDDDGRLVSPARITAYHNGVLIQDNFELTGPTRHYERSPYEAHPEKQPIRLQEHTGDRVRFRKIWIRELD